jgi:hypothetical protein
MSDVQPKPALSAGDAEKRIARLVKECREGISDCEADALQIADAAGIDEERVREDFAAARLLKAEAKGVFSRPDIQPRVETGLGAKLEAAKAKSEAAARPLTILRRRRLDDEGPNAGEPEEPKPDVEAKGVEAEGEPDVEAAYVEDAGNAANDILRKLWRIESALRHLKPEAWADEVGAVLWRMSKGNREAGCKIWVDWLGEEARTRWHAGFEDQRGSLKAIYRAAQLAGWRYPLAQNLNRLEEMAERTEAALVRVGAEVYQAAGRLVRPIKVEVQATKGRKTTVAVLEEIDPNYLKSALTGVIDFFRWKGDQRLGIGPTQELVGAILSRYGKWKFPEVTGIVTAPTLLRDGTVLAKEGLDPATGLLVKGPLPPMTAIPAKPTREEAEKAIRLLEELLVEFPFCDEPSRSVALSGLITPNVRAAMTCVPLHAFSATTPGTGKSYLADTIAGIALGDAMPNIAAGANSEETEKRLASSIMAGMTILSIDNVTAPIGGDALCQAIERPTYRARTLGRSEIREHRNSWCLFATSNNLRLRDDITRRTLLVRMDAREERPELRTFKGNPFEQVLANRGRYIRAALVVVLAYRAAGMPGRLPPIGDPFAEWSDNVRSALVWLGRADPVETMEVARERDIYRQARMALLQALLNAYGSEPRTAARR